MVKTIWNISKKHKEKVYNWEKHCCTAIRSAKIPIIPGDTFPWASLGLEEIKPGEKLNIQIGSWFYVFEKETEAKRYGKFVIFLFKWNSYYFKEFILL